MFRRRNRKDTQRRLVSPGLIRTGVDGRAVRRQDLVASDRRKKPMLAGRSASRRMR